MSYKVFTNGSPLPASDLNDFLMKQSVMTFASATERDAALTAPTEGMCVYLENNNHFQIRIDGNWVTQNPINAQGDLIVGNSSGQPARLGIGTNGQVLLSNGTTATWGTPSLASYRNWTQLATGAITTGSALFQLTGLTARDNYLLLVQNISSSSASANITVGFNSNTSDYASTVANIRGLATYSAGIVNDASGGSPIRIGTLSNNAASVLTGGMLVSGARATSSSLKMLDFWGSAGSAGGTGQEAIIGKGVFTATAAITSIEIRVTSGTIDNGTYFLYGSD